jgi:DNA replication protein DnaC
VLVIDDIGKEYRSNNNDFTETQFFALIRERVSNNRPTFITGNATPETIKEMYSKSSAEDFKVAIMSIEAKGPNLRDKKVKEDWSFLD